MTEKSDAREGAEYIVGTLLVRGVVKPEDVERAHNIVEEELAAWLTIREMNKLWPFAS
ncbi:hypothetical protein RAD15_18060 [Bradyrhizobium sp. 14AA]